MRKCSACGRGLDQDEGLCRCQREHVRYKSVTELAADNPNLGEYLAQLERNNEFIQEFIRKHALAVNDLTEKQLAAAIRQAIVCGDFIRNVRVFTNAQQVVYIPFAEQARLQARIRELEAEIEILRDYDDKPD